MQSDWPPAHSEALREYLAKGMSYSAIADAINTRFKTRYTRNAALGRAKRMGFGRTDRSLDGPKDEFKHGFKSLSIAEIPGPDETRSHRIREHVTPKPWRRPPVFEATETRKLRSADVVPRHLSLMELERRDCRYPYGGDADGEAITFCGHPRRRGSSYCAAHFNLSAGPGSASERAADQVLLEVLRDVLEVA